MHFNDCLSFWSVNLIIVDGFKLNKIERHCMNCRNPWKEVWNNNLNIYLQHHHTLDTLYLPYGCNPCVDRNHFDFHDFFFLFRILIYPVFFCLTIISFLISQQKDSSFRSCFLCTVKVCKIKKKSWLAFQDTYLKFTVEYWGES